MRLREKDATDEELKDGILRKFVRMRAGRARHVYEGDVPKGMPPHLRKRIMQCLRELVREGLVVEFPHGGERAYTFNMNRLAEIRHRIEGRDAG